MGNPKKQRRKFETPRFPWRADILQSELKLIGQYGLRNKRELWRHKTLLSKFRGNARSLLGAPKEQREKLEKQLLSRLQRLGMLSETAVLDNILDLTTEDILERRLQTLVFRKGLGKSIYQARQLISHGHISIENKRVNSPSYLVPQEEEAKIRYTPTSPIVDPNHPFHQLMSASQKVIAESPREKAKHLRGGGMRK